MTDRLAPGLLQEGVDLRRYNTLGVSARARYFATAKSRQQLQALVRWAAESGTPIQILGGGSNVVLKDDLTSLVIHVALRGKRWGDICPESATLSLEAGENWHDCVLYAARMGFRGIENLALIPGTAGAAPVQNIGAYGVELADTLTDVEVMDLASGELSILERGACGFAYRDSIFKQNPGRYCITRVRLELSRNRALALAYQGLVESLGTLLEDDLTPMAVAQAIIKLRRSKLPDPETLPNVGSFFKNPVVDQAHYDRLRSRFPDIVAFPDPGGMKLAAAWLIDRCGWKGYHDEHVGVHRQQALVLVNHGGGSGSEVLELAGRIQASVSDCFSVQLEIEPRVLP